MRKNARREELRARTQARSKGRGGRPDAPTRSEKDSIERARAKCRDFAVSAMETLGKGLKGKASAIQLKAADSILDRAGIPRGQEVVEKHDLGRELLALLDRNTKTDEE